ncbi:MAG: hypothetical protein ACP5OZ_03365 [Candidatus Woesearchaeota archaeon]
MEEKQKIEFGLESKVEEIPDIGQLREWQETQFFIEGAYDPKSLKGKLREINRAILTEYYGKISNDFIRNIAVKFAQFRGWDYSKVYEAVNKEVETLVESENRKLKQMQLYYYSLKDQIHYQRKEITKKGQDLRVYKQNTHLTEEEINDIDRILMYKKGGIQEEKLELKFLSPDFLNYSVSQLIDEKEKRCRIVDNADMKISQIEYEINKIGQKISELEDSARMWEIAINKKKEFLVNAYAIKSIYASREFAKALEGIINMGIDHEKVAEKIEQQSKIISGQLSVSDLAKEAIHLTNPNLTSAEVVESHQALSKELEAERNKQNKNSAKLSTRAEGYLEKYAYSTF